MTIHRPSPILVATIVGALAACASSSGGKGRAPCELARADTVYLDRGPVYRDCAVDKRARVIDRSVRPDFQPSTPPPGSDVCYRADVEFVVDATGTPEPETARVLRTNNPSYGEALLRAVTRWHYEPAVVNGMPVRQIVQEKGGVAVVSRVVRAGEVARPPDRRPVC